MKFLAVILSVYFLGLNFLPCEDGLISLGDEHQQEQVEHTDKHAPDAGDDCSPFCQCHCCHVHVVTSNNSSFEPVAPVISTLIIQKIQDLGTEVHNTHFQPPRV